MFKAQPPQTKDGSIRLPGVVAVWGKKKEQKAHAWSYGRVEPPRDPEGLADGTALPATRRVGKGGGKVASH